VNAIKYKMKKHSMLRGDNLFQLFTCRKRILLSGVLHPSPETRHYRITIQI